MEDSLDITLRKEIPAFESSLVKMAIEKGEDLTTKHVMIRGNLINILTLKGEVKIFVISDSD